MSMTRFGPRTRHQAVAVLTTERSLHVGHLGAATSFGNMSSGTHKPIGACKNDVSVGLPPWVWLMTGCPGCTIQSCRSLKNSSWSASHFALSCLALTSTWGPQTQAGFAFRDVPENKARWGARQHMAMGAGFNLTWFLIWVLLRLICALLKLFLMGELAIISERIAIAKIIIAKAVV
jgi:hypothetical protein